MATLTTSAGEISAGTSLSIKASVRRPTYLNSVEIADLIPMRMASYLLGPYRTRVGWPVSPPEYDIHTTSVVSANGEYTSARPSPQELVTTAAVRWIADDEYWDPISHYWHPFAGDLLSWRWITSEDYSPTFLTQHGYYVGKELFLRDMINFDATTHEHMWGDTPGGISTSYGYTVIMVALLSSAFGNSEGQSTSGLWCPGEATPDEDSFEETDIGFDVQMKNGMLNVNGANASSLTQAFAAARPVYIALNLSRPVTTTYVSFGPGSTVSSSAYVGEGDSAELSVVLGRTSGTRLQTADMAILDLGVYHGVLTTTEVENEIGILSACYGGNT